MKELLNKVLKYPLPKKLKEELADLLNQDRIVEDIGELTNIETIKVSFEDLKVGDVIFNKVTKHPNMVLSKKSGKLLLATATSRKTNTVGSEFKIRFQKKVSNIYTSITVEVGQEDRKYFWMGSISRRDVTEIKKELTRYLKSAL